MKRIKKIALISMGFAGFATSMYLINAHNYQSKNFNENKIEYFLNGSSIQKNSINEYKKELEKDDSSRISIFVDQHNYDLNSEENIKNKEKILNKISELFSDKQKYKFYSSKYSNIIFVFFKNFVIDEIKDKLDKVSNFENVKNILVSYSDYKSNSSENDYKIHDKVLNSRYLSNFASNKITKEDRLNIIKRTSYLKSAGHPDIKIGVLEVDEGNEDDGYALINPKNNDFFDENYFKTKVWNNWSLYGFFRKPGYSQHATEVGSIISGYNGINPNLDLLGVFFKQSDNVFYELDYLIENGAKVINMSYGKKKLSPDSKYLKYNDEAKIYDDYARNNPEILFVSSAGNEGNENVNKLSGKSLSKNIIVVGSNGNTGILSKFSSRGSTNDEREVTLLANGEYYLTRYKREIGDRYSSGTSFSAPLISGILGSSLYLYKKYFDMGKNNLIAKSVLTVSTFSNDKGNSKLGKDGGGTFDYSKLKQSFESLKYFSISNNKEVTTSDSYIAKTGQLIELGDVTAKENEIIRGAISWTYDGKYNWDISNPAVIDFDLVLKDDTGDVIFSSASITKNREFIKFQVKKPGNYKWYLKQYSSIPEKTSFEVAFAQSKGTN